MHVGAFKTGTSFLQSRLWHHRTELAEQGILFPGDRGWGDQVRAISHIAGRKDANGVAVPAEPWDEMVAAVVGWPGRSAILSFEFLSLARPRQIRRLVDAFAPAEVHVVITARDLVRAVPAMWQEVVQGGQTWSWAQYCETVTSPLARTVPPGRAFWRAQDLPGIVRRWASAIPVERIHLVTVPPAGAPADELWHRFRTATGIKAGPVPGATGVVTGSMEQAPGAGPGAELAGGPDADEPLPNESLDPVGTELMRRINLEVEGRMARGVYDRVLKLYVAKKVLAGRARPERVALSAEHVRWARDRGREMAADLRALGLPVIGDLDDLVGSPVVAPRAEPRPEDVLDAAVAVIAALAPRVTEARRGAAHTDAVATPVATIGSHPVSRLVRRAYERLRP